MSGSSEESRIRTEFLRTDRSHDPFSAAVHATRMPMLITDPRQADNPIVFSNEAFSRLTGYSREEVLGRNCRFLQGKATNRDDVGRIRDAVASRVPIEIELLNYKKDGAAFWNKLLVSPIFDEEGVLTYFIASQYDTTDSREHQQERMLQASLAESELSWQLTPDLLSVIDFASATFDRVNPAWTAALGWSREEMEGRSFEAFVHPDDVRKSQAVFHGARVGNPVLSFENRYRTKDGRWRWLSWLAFPQGEKLFSSSRDVTLAREHAEQLTAARGERDRLWSMPNLLLAVAAFDSTVVAVNPGWPTILGWPEAEVVGRSYAEFIHPDDAQRSLDWAARLAGGEAVEDLVNRFRSKNGSFRSIAWTITPGDGVFHCVGRDVTLEREQAATLAAAEEQLRQSQKLEAVGQLTGGVAHDFNNLLTIIRSSIDLLRRPDLPEARRTRYLDAVSETVDRAAKLTGQLLAFARRQALKPEVFEVGERLSSIADMLDAVTGARIVVSTEVPDQPCFVRADRSQFETALVNMAVNARDAMNGEGVLTLRVEGGLPMPPIRGHAGARGPFVAVSLTDTGPGIPKDMVGRIFEPFFTTKEVGKGTGLGLSQVFGFTKQSGGDIDVASREGQGTTFSVYLPEVASEVSVERATGISPARDGRGQKVLLVEDNLEVGRFATQIVRDLGYAPEWATNAEEALGMLGRDGSGFELVFSDVVMPGMGGIALAEELRQRLPDLPVLLTSGYSHVLAQEGGHGFELLHKPYSADGIARTFARMMHPADVAPEIDDQ